MAKAPVGNEMSAQRLLAARGHGFDPWHAYIQAIPMLVDRARSIRLNEDETKSYRIRVGCTAVATSLDGTELGIFGGGNTKITQTHPKVCAETRAIRRARKAGMANIIGLVVVGDLQPDDGSGVSSPTLHCCEECRAGNLAKLCNDDTLVMTVLPDKDWFQLHTARELIDHHAAAIAGLEIAQQPLFDDPEFKRWEGYRNHYGFALFDAGITGVEALVTGETRQVVVQAARQAITGAAPLI